MSNRDQKLNNIASKAGQMFRKGARRAGRRILSGAISSLSLFPGKIKKFLTVGGIILGGFIFLCVVYFFYYQGTGEGGGETGISDIDNNNRNLSEMSSSDNTKKPSGSSSGYATDTTDGAVEGDGDDLVEYALQYVGNPYVWGGESLTDGCDCSGFTMKVMEHFGVILPHNAFSQRSCGTKISEDELAPGDLVFYDGPDHVAIYIGGGQIVHASNPTDGIKVSSYNSSRTVAYCARYVEPGTSSHAVEGEGSQTIVKKKNTTTKYDEVTQNYSAPNKAFFNFFLDVSKNKSVYQVHTDEETGEEVLILSSDKDAVSDYFHNDDKFYVSPFLLYSINNHIWGTKYAYPEAFLNPIAHDENYNLSDISDKGSVKVKSVIRKRNGEDTGNVRYSTSDYGLASILKYREEDMVEEYKGTYIKEDYFDTTTGKVMQREISEPYSYEITHDTKNVLEWAQTFSGYVTYKYTDTSVKTEGCQSGKSEDPKSNYDEIYYKTEKVDVYIIVPESSSNRTSNQICTAYSLAAAKSYISSHPGYTIYGAVTDGDGNIISATTTTRRYKLYKYRGADSGRYTNFVEQSSTNSVEQTNNYLDEYLENFATYKPTTIDRDPEVFSGFVTITDNYSSGGKKTSSEGGSSSGGSSFSSCFNDEVIGEYIKTIWDTSIAYGHSEEQAAAIIGNMWWESDHFNINAISGDGYNSYGLCQWTDDRKTQLFDFASGYFGEDTSDQKCSFESQVEFAMMELDIENSYKWCNCQWRTTGSNCGYSHAEMYSNWLTSSDVDELTTAMCMTWERPSIPHVEERKSFAQDAYAELSGQSFGMELEVVEPSSSNGNGTGATSSSTSLSNTSGLTDKEKEIYKSFYSAADDVYESDNSFEYMETGLTKEQRNDTLLTASALSRGITKQKARLDMGEELWEEDYILNISEPSALKTLGESVGSVNLGMVSDFLDYDFLWPFAQDAMSNSGNWLESSKFSSRFGPRVSPTAGASSDHKGLDVSLASDTPLFAASAGTVSYVGDTGGGGYAVYINHGTDAEGRSIETRYFHLHTGSAVVSVGDSVEKGQKIALSDNSGTSTGPHLHYGIAVNGIYYNPLAFYDLSSVPMLTSSSGGSVENVDFYSVGSLPSDFEGSYYEWLYYCDGYSGWD